MKNGGKAGKRSMPAKLTLHPPNRPARFLVIRDGESLTVGRDPDCGLVIEDNRVSKHHARFTWSVDGWTLHDLGSKNGTSLDGAAVSATQMSAAGWLSFGGLVARFERIGEEEARALQADRLARLNTGIALRRRLSADLDPFDLLLRFLEAAVEVTGADRGFVLIAGSDGRLHAEVATGFAAAQVAEERFAGSVGAVERALATLASVVVSDAQRDPFLGTRPSVAGKGLGALACVPLRQDDRLLGLLYVDSPRARDAFTDLDVDILEALAEHTASVIGSLLREGKAAALGERRAKVGALDELQRRIDGLILPAPGVAPLFSGDPQAH